MKKLSLTQWIGASAGIAVVAIFLMTGGTVLSLFSSANGQVKGVSTEKTVEAVDTINTENNTQKMDTSIPGLQIKDEVVGTGTEAVKGSTVSVHYVGTLTNGTKFDSSVDRGTPFEFKIGEGRVIQGWEKGLVGMKVGGKRTLTIAPELGYGAQAIGPIPPNSTLVFEIQLLDVK